MHEPIGQFVSQSVHEPIDQFVSQSVHEPVGQRGVGRLVSQLVCHSVTQRVHQSVIISQSMHEPVSQFFN